MFLFIFSAVVQERCYILYLCVCKEATASIASQSNALTMPFIRKGAVEQEKKYVFSFSSFVRYSALVVRFVLYCYGCYYCCCSCCCCLYFDFGFRNQSFDFSSSSFSIFFSLSATEMLGVVTCTMTKENLQQWYKLLGND